MNGRVGKPEEIASAIYFLADNEQSAFMTGQALVVDGGATARLSTEWANRSACFRQNPPGEPPRVKSNVKRLYLPRP